MLEAVAAVPAQSLAARIEERRPTPPVSICHERGAISETQGRWPVPWLWPQSQPETSTARHMPLFPFALLTDIALAMPPFAPTPQA